MKQLIRAASVVGSLLLPAVAFGQEYPTAPVTLVIPFGAGASNDTYARFLGDGLSKLWGQPVVAENMPGAGGSIGMANVAKAEPDGYRLVFASSTFATNAAAQANLPYDPVTELQPVAKVADGQLIIVTGSRVPMKTVDDIVREAKAQTIFYGSTGPASAPTFLAKLLSDVTGISMEGANYTGGAEALVDLIGGRIDLYIGTVTTVLSAVQAGTATPVAVLGKSRSDLLPDVPTIAEAGYPNAEASIWFGLFGPAGMPEEVVAKINADTATVMQTPEAKALFEAQGATPSAMSVDEFEAVVAEELKKWKDLAVKYNIVSN